MGHGLVIRFPKNPTSFSSCDFVGYLYYKIIKDNLLYYVLLYYIVTGNVKNPTINMANICYVDTRSGIKITHNTDEDDDARACSNSPCE